MVLKDPSYLDIAVGVGVVLSILLVLCALCWLCVTCVRYRVMAGCGSGQGEEEQLVVKTPPWTSRRVWVVKNGSFLYLDLRRPPGKVFKWV